MNDIDRYLDQACQRVSGPATLRQHLRKELGEHLDEAVEDLIATGLSREEAAKQAIAGLGEPETIRQGRVFMALPPLYRISAGPLSEYARDDAHRDELLSTVFKGKKTEIGRFKGLGEMMASQLKETTMDPKKRTLARITVPDAETSIEDLVERLMGKRADARFQFIQENAQFVKEELDV